MSEQFDFDEIDQSEQDEFPKEKSNLTGSKTTEARLCVVQALHQARTMETPVKLVMEQFLLHELPTRKVDNKLFKAIMNDLQDSMPRYEEMAQNHLKEEWKLNRVDSVALCVILSAIAELVVQEKTPEKVIINEFLNISKGFVKPEETKFINAVLDSISKVVRSA